MALTVLLTSSYSASFLTQPDLAAVLSLFLGIFSGHRAEQLTLVHTLTLGYSGEVQGLPTALLCSLQ